MPAACLIVCERHGTWGLALRRALADLPATERSESGLPTVYETRSLPDCLAALRERAGSFVALAATAENVSRVAETVQTIARQRAPAQVVVLVERGLEAWEASLRSAGALEVTDSRRRLESIARLAVRHLRRLPKDPASLQDDLLNQLPWSPA